MKKLLFACSLACTALLAQAQVKLPAPSPTQTIRQDFGLGTIEITYSRPGTKGRSIFGGLEPFGSVWRTGANAATRITFTDKVELAGKKIDTGTYVIYSIPGIDTWEIIINKGINNWGTDGYKESDDVVRFKIDPTRLKQHVETFTIQFDNVTPQTCDLLLMWDKTLVKIPITTNIKDRLKAQVDAAMLTDKKPYWQAAQYYREYENNDNKALENISNAVKENPKAYYMWLYKARIEQSLGDKTAAMASSKTSMELSKEAKSDSYVRLNEELQKKLK